MPTRDGRALGRAILLGGCAAAVAAAAAPPKTYAPPSRPLRVLLYYDMEGISGATDVREFMFSDSARYRVGQRLLVGDVNAAVAGLFDGGATAVDVVDSHGSGNPGPDVPEAALDPRARTVVRDRPFDLYLGLVTPDAYDAVAAVGMHARGGGRGFLAHTFGPGYAAVLNDSALSETEVVGYAWGRVGVPVVFASGDDGLRDELAARMPWVRYATVKRDSGGFLGGYVGAVPLPLDEARRAIRAEAARAVRDLRAGGRAQVLTASWPATAAVRAVAPGTLRPLARVPGITYADERVTFAAPDLAAAVRGWAALGGVANQFGALAITQAMLDSAGGRPGAWVPAFIGRLLAGTGAAGDRAPAPAAAAPPPSAPRRYYGDP